eukprot:10269002-Lingulodinium_polyedra.AAC.1
MLPMWRSGCEARPLASLQKHAAMLLVRCCGCGSKPLTAAQSVRRCGWHEVVARRGLSPPPEARA